MALTLDPSELWMMSVGWCEARDDALFAAKQIEQDILTRWYSKASSTKAGHQPRNRGFGYMALLLPHLVQSAPRWKRRSDGTVLGEMVAEGTAAALTQLHRQQRLNRVLRPAAWDYGIAWCGAYVDFAPEGRRRITPEIRAKLKAPLGHAGVASPLYSQFDDPGAPRVTPLHPSRWGWDPLAKTWPEVRGYFHEAVYDIEDLHYMASLEPRKGEGRWKMEVIERLVEETDWKRLGYAGDRTHHGVDLELRRQVVLRQFWVPDAILPGRAPSENEHGVIVTIINVGDGQKGSNAQHIREPYYYAGHHTGPYAVSGMYQPSCSTFPMTRLMAAKDSTDMVNALAIASGQRMKRHRRVYLTDGSTVGEARKANHAADGEILGVQRLFQNGQPLIVPVDFGGLGASDIQMMQWAIGDNDEALAMMAAQQGATGQSSNATEVAVAAKSYETALDYTVGGWTDFMDQVGVKESHLVNTNYRFFMHMDRAGKERLRQLQVDMLVKEGTITREEGDQIVEQLVMEVTPWQGGDALEAGKRFDPESLGVQLEPYSMGGRGDMQIRAEDASFNAELFQLSQYQAAAPWIDFTSRFRALGEAYGKPGVERMIDKQKREQMLQAASLAEPSGQFGGFGPAASADDGSAPNR